MKKLFNKILINALNNQYAEIEISINFFLTGHERING